LVRTARRLLHTWRDLPASGALRLGRSWRVGLRIWRAGACGRHAGRAPDDLPALLEDHGGIPCPSAAGGPDDPRADAL